MVCDGFTEKRPKANSTPLSTRIGKHCVRFGCLFTVLVVNKCKLLKTGFKVQFLETIHFSSQCELQKANL